MYSATCIDQKFFISEKDVVALNEIVWEIAEWKSLELYLSHHGWDISTNDSGDVDMLQQTQHELCIVDIFEPIAPFVKEGSFITFQGEDGTTFRWLFTGKKVIEEDAVAILFVHEANEMIDAINVLEKVLSYCDTKMGLKEIEYWEAGGAGHKALTKLREFKHRLEG